MTYLPITVTKPGQHYYHSFEPTGRTVEGKEFEFVEGKEYRMQWPDGEFGRLTVKYDRKSVRDWHENYDELHPFATSQIHGVDVRLGVEEVLFCEEDL